MRDKIETREPKWNILKCLWKYTFNLRQPSFPLENIQNFNLCVDGDPPKGSRVAIAYIKSCHRSFLSFIFRSYPQKYKISYVIFSTLCVIITSREFTNCGINRIVCHISTKIVCLLKSIQSLEISLLKRLYRLYDAVIRSSDYE